MRAVKYSLLLFVVVAYVAGCSEPKIDASTNESMKQSVQEVLDALSDSDKAEFNDAMQILAFSQIDFKDIVADGATGAGILESRVRESLDGKTAAQIVAEADRVRAERKEKERVQALQEIQELETERLRSEQARENLKRFEVVRSRFYFQKREYSDDQPIIELAVRNGTSDAISRAYFKGTIASPNRSVPWHEDGFNYDIPGGLEPGEEATWRLAPNMFSDWGDVKAPADAIFTVTVEQLDTSEGEPLYSTRMFSQRDQERLNELKSKYSVE